MPCWFYDKKALLNTPSIQDGIDHETECQYRKEGAQLIIQIGSQMELGCNTLATGVVYFHRFYMFHSFKTFSPYITACCCLFLAGKAEETPKKSKDIIKIAKKFLTEDKLLALGENPREEVMTMEKILLQTMKFDLKVRHPYYFLFNYAKCLKGDKRKLHKVVQMAWTFINDSLCTTLSIQWEPEIIAIAVMHLAGKLVRLKIIGWSHRKPSQTHWWEIFVEDLCLEVVEDICHQVLDLYSPNSRYQVIEQTKVLKVEPQNGINSPPNFSTANTDTPISETDSTLRNGVNSVIAAPVISLKDPRLESKSVFATNPFCMKTPNTSVLVTSSDPSPGNILTPFPATPITPNLMVQQLPDSSRNISEPNISLAMESKPLENSRFPLFNGSTVKKGFGNDMQSIENRGFGFTNGNNNNNYTECRLVGHRGFGCMSNNNNGYWENGQIERRSFRGVENRNDDYPENRSMDSQGFRNYGRNNYSGHCHFRRRSFGNNCDSDDRIENRSLGNRGFGNSSNSNNRHNENELIGNRGFGNTKCSDSGSLNDNGSIEKAVDDTEAKPLWSRGFGNANNNNESKPLWSRGFGNNNKEAKPLGTRGFGNNANHYNNDCNGNDPRRRVRFNRENRFQRSGSYPKRFNNNYERDRYFHNDGNRDVASNHSMSDAPGKIVVDKQRFYRPSNENTNNDNKEEESWD